MNIRTIGSYMIPPGLALLAKRLADRLRAAPGQAEWEFIPEGWDYLKTHPDLRGWSAADIGDVYRSKWEKFKSLLGGSGPLGFAHESKLDGRTNVKHHNVNMSFAYALGKAAWKKDRVTFLDYGGGIGHYYLIATALFPELDIQYTCRDLPNLCRLGRELLPQARFYEDNSCLATRYDFVMASGTLHYNADWQTELGKLAGATGDYLYVANLPVVFGVPSYVFIQRPGYHTEYLAWCLNQADFLKQAADSGLRLVREFVSGYEPKIVGAPEPMTFRHYLFTRRAQDSNV